MLFVLQLLLSIWLLIILKFIFCRKNNQHTHPIKHVSVRKDQYGVIVSRGRLELIGGLEDFMLKPQSTLSKTSQNKQTKKYKYDEFRKLLQCVEYEPQFYANGIYHLLKIYPITKDIIELTAAFAEKPCLDGHKRIDWQSCQNTVNLLKNNKRNELNNIQKQTNYELENVRLMRIINGSLYYDWPFQSEVNWKIDSQYTFLRLILGTLNKISDLPDSVFMSITFDYPLLPSYWPMAFLSQGPTTSNSDIPFPWTLVLNDEIIIHNQYFSKNKIYNNEIMDANSEHSKNFDPYNISNNNYTDIYNKYYNPDNDIVWKNRENKAAFFGSLWFSQISIGRQIIIDLAKLYPDLIVANYTHNIGANNYKYPKINDKIVYKNNIDDIKEYKLHKMISLNQYMRQYKYLIVLAGNSISGNIIKLSIN